MNGKVLTFKVFSEFCVVTINDVFLTASTVNLCHKETSVSMTMQREQQKFLLRRKTLVTISSLFPHTCKRASMLH
jgi:tmRNA-binding protein